MVKKGEFRAFVKGLDDDRLDTNLSIMKELAEKIDDLEERIKVLENAKKG